MFTPTATRGLMAGLAALALVSLAACGGGTPAATTTSPAAPVTETPTAPAEPVTITYLHRLPDGEGMTAVKDIVAKWNADNPGIQVEATKFDGVAAEMIKKLETDIKANAGPCLAQLGYGEVPEMFVKGLVEDVTTEAEKYKANFGGAYGQMTVAGKVVGLPQDSGPLIYMYNEAEFGKLGIEVPTTLDEFKAAAAKAAKAKKYIAAFTPDEAHYWLSAQSAAAGGTWFSVVNDQWQVNADSAESAVVAGFWQGLLDDKSVLTTERWGEGFGKALDNGTLIGHIAAAWEVGFALDSLDGTPAEGQWRVAQLPTFGATQLTGPDGGSGVAVMKGCAHPAEAMEFNNWFNTQVDDLASQGLVPAATKPAANPEKWTRQFGGQDVMAELVTANANLNPEFPYIPGWSAVGPKMNTAAADAAAGKGKVADIFTAAQAASIAALKDAGLPVAG